MGERHAAASASGGMRTVIDAVRRRLQGLNEVDPWGLDADVLAIIDPLTTARWRIETAGATHVPLEGPLLFVANRCLGWSEPLVLGRALFAATGRRLRFAAMPDRAPVSTVLRAIGGVVADAAEVRALLRNDEMVAMFGAPTPLRCRTLGRIDPLLLEPAIDLGAPVLPVALRGHELGRRWRVAVGPPVELDEPLSSAVHTVAAAWSTV